MREEFDTAEASQANGPVIGFLTTRIMSTERQPVHADRKGGKTPGQLIDAEISRLNTEFCERGRQCPEARQPELHSITFEFPIE